MSDHWHRNQVAYPIQPPMQTIRAQHQEYRIVCGWSILELEEYVNELLQQGWRVSGSLTIGQHAEGGWMYYQPVVREVR